MQRRKFFSSHILRGGGMLGGVGGEVARARDTELLHSFMRSDPGPGEESGGDEEAGGGGSGSGGQGRGGRYRKTPTPPPAQAQPLRFDRHKKEPSFVQISKEIKAKQVSLASPYGGGKKGRREEEIYTDKDRAAAVNLGSRDIKQSLKMKRKMEKSKALQIPEETEPGTLLALGNHEVKVGNTRLALGFFNKALDLNAEDKTALVARSQCHLLLGEPQKALEDAEAALAIDKTYTRGLLQKAEALYHLGDFEYSLVYFHRGLRIRPEMREFKLGVQKAQEAIENVIGDNKVVFPTSPRVLKKMFQYVQDKKENKAVSNEASKTNLFNKDQNKKNPVVARRIEKHILGELYQDKHYLEQLLNNTDILSLNQDFANNDIAQHAEEGIAYLKTRQEFWRQQKSSMAPRKPLKQNKTNGKPK